MRTLLSILFISSSLAFADAPKNSVTDYIEWVRTNTINPNMTNVANSMSANQVGNYNSTNTFGALARLDTVNSNQIDAGTFNLTTNLPTTTKAIVTNVLNATDLGNVMGYPIRNCQTNRVTFSGTSVTITWARAFSTALYAVNVTPLASLGIGVVTVYPSVKTTTNCTLTATISLSQSFDVMGCE